MTAPRSQSWREQLAESLIKTAGWVSSIVVVIIVIFLFQEGFSLFTQPAIDEGLVVAVHPENPVEELRPEEYRALLAEETTWPALGGPDAPVYVLTLAELEKALKKEGIIKKRAEEAVGQDFSGLPAVIDSLARNQRGALLVFTEKSLPESFKRIAVGNVGVGEFLVGPNWEPAESPAPEFGAWPLIWGTLLVTIGALLFALLLGPPVAIYLAELASPAMRGVLKPVVELLASIPSVVFGFLGLVIVVPFIRETFDLDSGSTALAGSFLLAIVALPTIISVGEDALRATPKHLKEASLGLGATHWQTIWRVILPYARPGLLAALILGVGRIVGETMVVLMVTGNNPQLVGFDFLASVRTMSASIAAEMGEAPQGGLHYKALFAVGGVLFILTFAINLAGEFIKSRSVAR